MTCCESLIAQSLDGELPQCLKVTGIPECLIGKVETLDHNLASICGMKTKFCRKVGSIQKRQKVQWFPAGIASVENFG